MRVHPELKHTTPHNRRLAIERIIDAWLIDMTGFVSIPQLAQTTVNTPIPQRTTHAGPFTAFRPPNYGRALVYPVSAMVKAYGDKWEKYFHGEKVTGLIDVKGTGVGPGVTPSIKDHSNGLMSLAGPMVIW